MISTIHSKEEKFEQNVPKKPIREEWACILIILNTILIIRAALLTTLTPILLLIGLSAHITILLLTKFNESNPHPLLHFNRTIESVIIAANPLAAIFYFFTWLTEGMTDFSEIRAQIALIYCYFMLIYVVFASFPFIGLYYVIKLGFWSGIFLNYIIPYDYPIIISPGIAIIILMGLGGWFTQTAFIWTTLGKKETFGKDTEKYQKIGLLVFIIQLIIGVVLIPCEIYIIDGLLPLLNQYIIILWGI